jgi:hypothetical protein
VLFNIISNQPRLGKALPFFPPWGDARLLHAARKEKAMTITANQKQELFVIETSHGVSTAGFTHVYKSTKQLAEKLGVPQPSQAQIGNVVQYEQYRALLRIAERRGLKDTWFEPDTSKEVQRVLEKVRGNHTKIRVHYGDTSTGKAWLEENDVLGFVGRSAGTLKTPLLMSDRNTRFGDAMLTNRIVRIQDAKTGADLYRHPNYNTPKMVIVSSDIEGYAATVQVDGKVQARFSSSAQAKGYVAFMKGEAMSL